MPLTLADLPGAGAPAALDTATVLGEVTRFRHVLSLAIPTGGQAQGLAINPGCQCDATFATREFDALAPGAAEAATLANGGQGLVLTLAVARPITRIRLTNAQAGDAVHAFRFDGSNVAEDPVAAGTHVAGQGATLNVTDRRLLLRRQRGASTLALTPADIAGIHVQAIPANPRLSFLLAGDEEGEQALPPAVDAAGAPSMPLAQQAGSRLAAALNAQLARLASGLPSLPESLGLDLIFAADSPCQVTLTNLLIDTTLERQGFALDGKQTLRFPGGSRETRLVPVTLPPGVTVLEAVLHLTHSAGAAPATARLAPAAAAAAPVAGDQGLRIPAGRMAGGTLTLETAQVVTGLEVALGGLQTTAQAVVSLWSDVASLPGTAIAESTPLAIPAGRPAARQYVFAAPVAVPAGRIWLVARADTGDLVLGLTASASSALGTSDGQSWTAVKAGQGLAPAARLLSPLPAGAEVPDTMLSLRLGGMPLAVTMAGKEQVADLAPALNQGVAGTPALEVSSALPGIVTLQPPLLRYRLGAPV